jgi:isocitrate dehydrogenase kinase/phosphatase
MACEGVQKTGKRGVYRLFLNYLNQPIQVIIAPAFQTQTQFFQL